MCRFNCRSVAIATIAMYSMLAFVMLRNSDTVRAQSSRWLGTGVIEDHSLKDIANATLGVCNACDYALPKSVYDC